MFFLYSETKMQNFACRQRHMTFWGMFCVFFLLIDSLLARFDTNRVSLTFEAAAENG